MERGCKRTVGRRRENEIVLFMRETCSSLILKMQAHSALCKLCGSCGTWKKLAAAGSIVEVFSARAYSLSPSRSMMSVGGNSENS